MRSLRKRTQGRSAAILQRRVPRCLHEKIEAGYTEVPRTNRRKKAAQAWTLKVKLGHDSRPPAQGLQESRRQGGAFGHRSPARQSTLGNDGSIERAARPTVAKSSKAWAWPRLLISVVQGPALLCRQGRSSSGSRSQPEPVFQPLRFEAKP